MRSRRLSLLGSVLLLVPLPSCLPPKPLKYDCSQADHEMWLRVYETCRENNTGDEWCRTTANEAICQPIVKKEGKP